MFQNFFKSASAPDPLQLNFGANKTVRDEFIQHLGYTPLVYYNEIQIQPADLIFLNLSLKENIPQVKITFVDTNGLINQRGLPIDNTKLSVFINTRTTINKTILIQFKIINIKRESGLTFTIKAAIDLDELYTINYESFLKSSSLDVMKRVAKQLGLGFSSNITSTNDRMNWLNYGRKVYQFLKYVANNGYISDNDFCSYYIDYSYNLNYINIQKELLRDVKNDEMMVDNFQPEAVVNSKMPLSKAPTILTTDPSASKTNNYISSYTLLNNSTSISLQEGYIKTVFYYDNQKKEKLIFELDTLSDNTNKKNLISLKSPADKNFLKSNFTQEYIGKFDSDNMHKNYNYADFLNNRNLQELEKITVIATLPTPNFSLYVFQKIRVMFINQTQQMFANIVNERLTGYFLITNIKFEFSGGVFSQILHLSRRDLTLSDLEQK
ncbi:MAG: hypothetical protein EBS55_04865 [Flavobacteriaceae bacterium]|jgi:AraC-like DNA-binding protein|nr:hypothetical protein [Flavobacteriaceae bacterium]